MGTRCSQCALNYQCSKVSDYVAKVRRQTYQTHRTRSPPWTTDAVSVLSTNIVSDYVAKARRTTYRDNRTRRQQSTARTPGLVSPSNQRWWIHTTLVTLLRPQRAPDPILFNVEWSVKIKSSANVHSTQHEKATTADKKKFR